MNMKIVTFLPERFSQDRMMNNVIVSFDANGVAEVDDNVVEEILACHDTVRLLEMVSDDIVKKNNDADETNDENKPEITSNSSNENNPNFVPDEGLNEGNKTDVENTKGGDPTYESLMENTKVQLVEICESLKISYNNVKDNKSDLAKKIMEVYSKADQ